MNNPPTIFWDKGCVIIIDQTKLPHKLKNITCKDLPTLWAAIKRLAVRGAPALGVAAAFGVLLGLKTFKGKTTRQLVDHVFKTAEYIGTSRPTAVNLFNALDEMKKVAIKHRLSTVEELMTALHQRAFEMYEQDRRVCRQMGAYGAKLIRSGMTAMTICNAGALATVDYGTALGVFYSAKENKKKFKVYACETRPLLQGARLTAWELKRAKIDVTLICDNMAATVMKQGKVDIIFTGADRVASNGDAANKIGTYNLAVLARYHKIPFYVVAPLSTFDLTIKSGKQIPIEERHADEVLCFGGVRTVPKGVKVFNPSFDVTDACLISGIVTEVGIIQPVNATNVKKAFN